MCIVYHLTFFLLIYAVSYIKFGNIRQIFNIILSLANIYLNKASSSGGRNAGAEHGIGSKIRVNVEDFPHAIAARVVRGPDWQFENEDGGEGNMGTLLGLYPAARGWARVRWDNGSRAESYHRVGAEGSFDLAFVGPAPIPPLTAQGWVQARPGEPGT